MTKTGKFLFQTMQLFLFALFLVPSLAISATDVVNGDFVYVQEGDGSHIQYHVSSVDYQGTPAWHISWDCEQLKAEHYVRRSDGAPLYTKRINHLQKHTVEISYSHDGQNPSIYRKRSENEFIERKIWDTGLRDLGALPQLLLGFAQSESGSDVTFSAISYDDGKVYPLIAKHSGFRNVSISGERVRCAIYDVKLDSWLATFVGKTRLLIPLTKQVSNFVSYSGPGLDGGDDMWSLKLVGKGSSLAMVEIEEGGITQ